MGVVAGAYVIAAFGAGRLADAVGVHRLMRVSIWVYGVGLLVGAGLSSFGSFLIGLPLIALAGAVVMTLPYGILVGMTPAGAEGALTGLFSFSRALGAVLGPIVVGVSIDVLAPVFPATNGYGAMWIAIGAPILLSLPFFNALKTGDEPQVEAASRSSRRWTTSRWPPRSTRHQPAHSRMAPATGAGSSRSPLRYLVGTRCGRPRRPLAGNRTPQLGLAPPEDAGWPHSGRAVPLRACSHAPKTSRT